MYIYTVAGLPTPGTLEHTITLALYNANQNFNQFINSLSGNGINGQPAADNKIGQAAVDTAVAEGPGILGAVSVLPQTITAAANQVFATPLQDLLGRHCQTL